MVIQRVLAMAMPVALVLGHLSANRIQCIASHVVNLPARRKFAVEREEDLLDQILSHFAGASSTIRVADKMRPPTVEQFVDQPCCLSPLLGGSFQKRYPSVRLYRDVLH